MAELRSECGRMDKSPPRRIPRHLYRFFRIRRWVRPLKWHHRLNGHELEQLWEIRKDRETWSVAVHGATESDATEHMNVYSASGTELRSHMHCIVITIILGESNYYYAHLIGEERGLENFQGHRIFQWKIQGLTPVSQCQSKSYLL